MLVGSKSGEPTLKDGMKGIFKKIGIIIALLTGLVGILLLTSFFFNKHAVELWLQNPQPRALPEEYVRNAAMQKKVTTFNLTALT